MSTFGQAMLVMFGTIILIVVGLFYLRRWNCAQHAKSQANFEKRQRINRVEYEVWSEKERKTAQYILSHNPSDLEILQVIENSKSPADRALAIEIALKSGNLMTISLVHGHVPENSTQYIIAFYDVWFSRLDSEGALKALEDWKIWDDSNDEMGRWWRTWKPKLESKASWIIAHRKEEVRKQKRSERIRLAEANGQRICYRCGTIDYPTCRNCDTCISGEGECTDYGEYCWFHWFDDD
jgi:hypothetical protein